MNEDHAFDGATTETMAAEMMYVDEHAMPGSKQNDPENTEEQLVDGPMLTQPGNVVREGDYIVLAFGDGRQYFAHCVKSWKGKSPPVKINKRSYPTANLLGLPYGTVLELGRGGLVPLPEGEDVLPDPSAIFRSDDDDADTEEISAVASSSPSQAPSSEQNNDNRNLFDNNTSQSMKQAQLMSLRSAGAKGHMIVAALVESSSTFEAKTDFSKAKYIARKQKKYLQRCRMVRCTASAICEALYLKDPRKLMNLREDTLAQILSYSNVSAGCQVLLVETCMGVVTGALAQRMGGYGKILSVYNGQQPSFTDMIARFNLSFAENHSIKWVHSGEVFGDDTDVPSSDEPQDLERAERERLEWPCPLQDHTRAYMEKMKTQREQTAFLTKRCARFARKLTRHTTIEAKEFLTRPCDSVIVAARYDPTATLLPLLKFLAPSCPFVVFHEFLEPLAECFRELQRQNLAINLRLSDTWMREYQVLPGRTHPAMNMSQNGGFLLFGVKLCPVTGRNELDDKLLKELRAQVGGRRSRRPKQRNENGDATFKNGRGKKNKNNTTTASRDVKRARVDTT